VERIWTARSERAGEFLSVAASSCELVVSRYQDDVFLTVRGPETRATTYDCPADGESRAFWLDGSALEYPTFENADGFVARLLRKGIVARDRTVEAVAGGQSPGLSLRSAQRHFLRATGITHGMFRQIERARHATTLLREGLAIADVVHQAGYYDQPHLSRSLKHLIGQTPTEVARRTKQLSLLYKTAPPPAPENAAEGEDQNHHAKSSRGSGSVARWRPGRRQ
jgi:AraC-like DNA-binding protein